MYFFNPISMPSPPDFSACFTSIIAYLVPQPPRFCSHHLLVRQNRQTAAMSSPHTRTSGGMHSSVHQLDEEEDDDICPICEGACTCNTNTKTIVPQSQNQTSSQIIPSSSVPTHSATVAPLKIKLTISAALLTRLPTSKAPTTTTPPKRQSKDTDASNRAKRLGRPPKTAIRTKPPHAGTLSNVKDKKFTRPKSTAKDTTGKSSKRRTKACKNDERGPGYGSAFSRRSHNTDAGGPMMACNPNQDFPTFVSADEFSSAYESSAGSSSSSEESELTDFSDSSIAEEEETFIRTTEEQRARAHDKARVKRELLGDDLAKRKERQTDWEIRSRTKSVSPGVNGMDVDSDETDDEAEDGAEEADDNDGDDDDDDDDAGSARRSYVGIATGWSEGEESSFDADLFFAGLGDSDSGPEQPTVHDKNAAADTDDDNSSLDIEPSSHGQGVFEITEGWDGSVIFTNGLQDGQGLLDWDFEANAAQLLTEAATSSGHDSGSDADMRISGSDADMGDGENENDSLEEVESNDGDTTEEELVDEQGLPTARAMRIFRPPAAQFYSINPLSTMSPGPHVEETFSNLSPQPSDILAGHGFVDDDEDAPEPPMSEIGSTVLSALSDRSTPRFPLMGTFEAPRTNSLRRAVIDGTPHSIPSPFQRSCRRRFSGSVSAQSASRVCL